MQYIKRSINLFGFIDMNCYQLDRVYYVCVDMEEEKYSRGHLSHFVPNWMDGTQKCLCIRFISSFYALIAQKVYSFPMNIRTRLWHTVKMVISYALVMKGATASTAMLLTCFSWNVAGGLTVSYEIGYSLDIYQFCISNFPLSLDDVTRVIASDPPVTRVFAQQIALFSQT